MRRFHVNPKIFVGAAVAVFAAILAVVSFSGPSLIDDVSGGTLLRSPDQTAGEVLPLEIELVDVSVTEISERASTIQVQFLVTNPNVKSVILQLVKYELYESGERIHIGEIGERPDVFLTESNYFTLLSDQPTLLSDRFTMRNTGNTPDLWNALLHDTPSWRVSGEAFFSLSSMTAGGERIVSFEFVPDA